MGWYIEPVTQMYALDGRTIYVLDSEVEAHKNVGWYLTPVTTMYAPDGRTIVIPQDEVTAYQNVGWYETEAQAASQEATPMAHYKYVYDGQGNIVRSIDVLGEKEYNYSYEDEEITIFICLVKRIQML